MSSNEVNGLKNDKDLFRASRDLPEMHKIAVEALEYDRGLVQRCVAVAVGVSEANTDVMITQSAEIASNTVTHMNEMMIMMKDMMSEMKSMQMEMNTMMMSLQTKMSEAEKAVDDKKAELSDLNKNTANKWYKLAAIGIASVASLVSFLTGKSVA